MCDVCISLFSSFLCYVQLLFRHTKVCTRTKQTHISNTSLTFCRLVGLSCVLSMIFIATCEENNGRRNEQRRSHRDTLIQLIQSLQTALQQKHNTAGFKRVLTLFSSSFICWLFSKQGTNYMFKQKLKTLKFGFCTLNNQFTKNPKINI